MKSSKNKAVFLDRDGVINQKMPESDYVKNWQEFIFLPGVLDALKILSKLNYKNIIVTNQRGIARGFLTEDDLAKIHQKMLDVIEKNNARIDKIYYCPHEIDACDCRKPSPKMFLQARRDFSLDLSSSWIIGDSESDILSGKIIGAKTILITRFFDANTSLVEPDYVVDKFLQAVEIIKNEK